MDENQNENREDIQRKPTSRQPALNISHPTFRPVTLTMTGINDHFCEILIKSMEGAGHGCVGG